MAEVPKKDAGKFAPSRADALDSLAKYVLELCSVLEEFKSVVLNT